MRTESVSPERPTWRSRSNIRTSPLLQVLDLRLALILVLALLAGALAYQSPPASAVAVGWLGDRLFLRASEGQAAADALSFYGDELTDSAGSGRSRWTHRAGAALTFPGLGSGDLTLTLRAQGWPEDVLGTRARQPEVTVEADGRVLSRFTPTPAWADYTFRIPAELRAGPDLTVTLRVSDAFTSTARYADPRPKGIRLERVSVYGAPAAGVAAPAPGPLAWLLLCGALWLLALVALSGRPTLGFVLATVLVAGVAVGLTAVRAWAAALLPWLAAGSGLLLAVAWRAAIVDLAARLVRRYARGSAINYGLVAAGASWLALVAAQASSSLQLPGLNAFWDTFPDSLIYGMLWTGLALLVIVRGKDGLPRLSNMIAGLLGHPRAAPALLALFLLVWLGYAAAVAAGMPYVGHADYADNAVVARNLVAGRGFVVDYVTQFYQLYDGVTRPQETWPLLQPLWIAPFFALLGPSDWAAKIPNLIFAAALALLIYTAGARLWDRRVGLTAAVFVLTSYLFFRLLIYATSDLAFVALSFGAIWALYRAVTNDGRRTTDDGGRTQGRRGGLRSLVVGRRSFVISGVLTGLMLLQKPGSGGLIALGMGLWLLRVQLAACSLQLGWGKSTIYHLHSALRPLLVWGVIALTILSPYLARNMALFGRPFYSTESMDAWVLEYTDWDAIYGVYTTEGGLSALGVPDATWVLRWGFDRTLAKIGRQVLAARDYLVPAWPGLPLGLGEVLTGREDKGRLLFEMGAWLSLLGAIGSIDGRRRLLGLLLAAFLPYALFLALYWHTNEERYWVALMPWLALLAAGALWRGYDRVAAIGDGRWAPLGLALVVTAATLTVRPSWPDIAEKVEVEPQLYAADLQAYAWLRANAEPGAVVMTRVPWQLNWHSGLPALMIPNTADREVFLRIARHYRARYLVYDSLQSPPRAARPMLESLIADPALGVELVYTSPVHAVTADGTYKELATEVYRLPEDYGGVAPVVGEGQGGRSPP